MKKKKKMKKQLAVAMMLVAFVLTAGIAHATPSSTYWTPMTLDIQSYGVPHIGVDNYFTIGKKSGSNFPTDVGLTVGVLPFDKLQIEVGVDYLGGPADYPA